MKVHADTNYLNEQGTVYGSASVAIHKDYSNVRYINDIAVIHVDRDIKFKDKVKAIKLTSTNVDSGPCKLTGWGTTKVCNCKLV